MIAGRKSGQPAAAAKRRKLGRSTRAAVIRAAEAAITEDPQLIHNLSKLSRAVEASRHPELRKKDGSYVGYDAIYKHLHAARKDGFL